MHLKILVKIYCNLLIFFLSEARSTSLKENSYLTKNTLKLMHIDRWDYQTQIGKKIINNYTKKGKI